LKIEGIDDDDDLLSPEDQARYRSATAVLLHMMRWSRAEVMNAVRDCSRYMQSARKSHNKALNRLTGFRLWRQYRRQFWGHFFKGAFLPQKWDDLPPF
jgi:hypothetical protein